MIKSQCQSSRVLGNKERIRRGQRYLLAEAWEKLLRLCLELVLPLYLGARLAASELVYLLPFLRRNLFGWHAKREQRHFKVPVVTRERRGRL